MSNTPLKLKMTNDQRMRQHNHNAHQGRLYMAKSCIYSIAHSDTITPQARLLFKAVLQALEDPELKASLDYRVNADGQTTRVRWLIREQQEAAMKQFLETK